MDATTDVDCVACVSHGRCHGDGGFAFVDPEALQWFDQPVNLSREGVYTVAFFLFWLVITISGALTTLLSFSPFEFNHRESSETDRPADNPKYVS